MRIVPVVDVRGGVAVHAIKGERAAYRPVRSTLTDSSAPRDVARAFRDLLGLDWLYLADLDALMDRREPAEALAEALATDGARLIFDAGVEDSSRARSLVDRGVDGVVVALETLRDPAGLERVVDAIGPERAVFSLDLRGGVPLGGPTVWRELAPLDIALAATACGIRRLIVLDLAAVGAGCGCITSALVSELGQRRPQLEITTGGGVRCADDLVALSATGAEAALVATALHTGAIGPGELAAFA